MNYPLVSILIPCHNAEKWLAETLTSAINQTWQSTEVIVVDDGSTDNSLAIARKFQSNTVKVFSQANQGASAARNLALQQAQGDFIQYLDADDLLSPRKIEQQMKLLQQNSSGYVASGAWTRFYNDISEAAFKPQPLWQNLNPTDWLICAWEHNNMMHPAAWLIPRAIAERAGVWNETLTLNDDGEYFSRIVLASKGVKFCSAAKVYYRSGIQGSLSGSKSADAWMSLWRSLQLDRDHLLKVENTYRTRRVCANRFQRMIYDLYPKYPRLLKQIEAEILQLGGSDLPPVGSPRFHQVSHLFGWKLAKRLQDITSYQAFNPFAA